MNIRKRALRFLKAHKDITYLNWDKDSPAEKIDWIQFLKDKGGADETPMLDECLKILNGL